MASLEQTTHWMHAFVSKYVAEFIFFFFKVGESMLDPIVRLYMYSGICSMTYKNETVCSNMSGYPGVEEFVQETTADYLMYYKLLTTIPAVVLGLFCGAWSDLNGRKMPVMLTSFGTILSVVFLMISVVMTDMTPFAVFVLIGAAVRGCCGKSAVMTMGLHSYVSDSSTTTERTERLGRLLAMNHFGFTLGSLVGGALLEVVGFDVVFCFVAAMNGICVLIAFFFMKETVPVSQEVTELISERAQEGEAREEPAVKRAPYSFQNVRESLGVLFRPRLDRGRCHLISFIIVMTTYQMCKAGETDITLLFVEHSPLSWRKPTYGYLQAVNYASLGVAVMVFLPLLIHYLQCDDFVLVLLGLFFRILRLLILASSDYTWMVFFAVVFSAPSAMVVSGTKSLISKSVEEHEMGKIFSILSCGEIVAGLLGSISFISMYAATLEMFAGFAFLVGSVVHVCLFVLMSSLWKDSKRTAQYRHLQSLVREDSAAHAQYGSMSASLLDTEAETPRECVTRNDGGDKIHQSALDDLRKLQKDKSDESIGPDGRGGVTNKALDTVQESTSQQLDGASSQ